MLDTTTSTRRQSARKTSLRWLAAGLLPALMLGGCARQTPTEDPLPMLAQLRQQQLAEQAQLPLTYQGEEVTLASDQEQQLHQFLGQRDPEKIALISGPGPQTDMLESARLASARLGKLTSLLGARAIELEPRYDPMLAPNTLMIRVLLTNPAKPLSATGQAQ
ncbi:hypothetical protein [Aeromonas jandaei]|uniref:hypothetical protein n=1 Tax=Aeromonas jandaei TaxID=650 RepID=UPI0038CFF877